MPLPQQLLHNLALPAIGAPMFQILGPEVVVAQTKAGMIGSFPTPNARTPEILANWLRQSLVVAGDDPANIPEDKKPNFENAQDDAKAWKNVWSAGQGVGAVRAIEPTAQIVTRLKAEYDAACGLPHFDMKE